MMIAVGISHSRMSWALNDEEVPGGLLLWAPAQSAATVLSCIDSR